MVFAFGIKWDYDSIQLFSIVKYYKIIFLYYYDNGYLETYTSRTAEYTPLDDNYISIVYFEQEM